MEQRRLGSSGLQVSAIGLGANTFGRTVDGDEAVGVIRRALDLDAEPATRARAVSAAKATVGRAARFIGQNAVQLHGGIGMTWEHPAHLYLKRAKADQLAFGTPGAHRARLAALVDLPPAASTVRTGAAVAP